MSIKLYGIPSCGTVKKAKNWLDEQGVAYEFVDFRKAPASRGQVDTWVAALGAKAMRNTSGGAYRALGDEKKTWSDQQWAEAFAGDAMLIKRPIIERDGKPVQVGFRASEDELKARLL